MQKKIIVAVVLIAALGLAVFSWFVFGRKKSIDISVQNSVSESEQPAALQEVSDVEDAPSGQPAENIAAEKTIPAQPAPVKKDDVKTDSVAASDATKNTGPVKSDDHGVNKIVDRFISWGFQKASDRKIDTIIVHSSYDAIGKDPYSIDGIIAEYKQYEVSAHYLIARDGTAYRLVADQNIAWHAGVATMPDGRTGVNAFSLGIEMVNTQDGKFTAAQYAELNSLIVSLKKQYPIKYILGHNDIAPGRKTDPWGMDWSKVQK